MDEGLESQDVMMCYDELELVAVQKEDWLAVLDPGYDYQDLEQRD